MAIVSLQNVQIGFEGTAVLDALDWQIQRGEKVGLVGPNGSGKTTLFRLITGELAPQVGTVTRSRGLQIAYLPQEPALDSTKTLLAETTATFEHVRKLEQRVAEAAQRIADHHDTDRIDEIMAEYDELQHRLEAAGGYHYEVTVREVLGGLGFTPDDYDKPIAALSGGQKCRAALAGLLLQEADLLLLDEPTNHLDLEATRYLEKYLAGYHGAAVIVSHDRYLLDRVVVKIADLHDRKIDVYPCGYSDYVETKHVRELSEQRSYQRQQEWIRHQREYAERVKADKSRAKQARGRLRRLDRMERTGQVKNKPVSHRRRMALQFTPSRRGGDRVLSCREVSKAYGPTVLFENFELEIYRGEKVGIVGPNGVGKSTLLKMAMRQVEPDRGQVRLYENLDVGYYDQEHASLDTDQSVLAAIDPSAHGTRQAQQVRAFLARFLFFGDEVYKRVGDLSGGQQSRVMLARLVWSNPQVLILDEPTNHLDIPGREALEEALIAYEGAILLVSHDRYFLDRVINKLLILPERGRYEYIPGNWSTYEQKLADEEAQRRAEREAKSTAVRRRGTPRRRQQSGTDSVTEDDAPYAGFSLAQIEQAIIGREEELADAEARFADPELYRDPELARALRAKCEQWRAELADLNTAWESRIEQE